MKNRLTSAGWIKAAIAVLPGLAGCSGGVLDPQGPIATAERTILLDSVAVMMIVVIPTMLATLGVVWWFRASNPRARHLPHFVYSGRLEFITWSIPALVVLFLGGIAWVSSHRLDPFRPLDSRIAPIDVQVVSLDWKWLFIFPQLGVASVNLLPVPTGTPLHFSLTAGTVMNSFFVPQLGSQIYTMAGMTSQLNLQADRPGNFTGWSYLFSGEGFPDMHFEVKALDPREFDAWVAQTRQGGGTLDTAVYKDLLHPGLTVPRTWGAVEPRLFQQILQLSVLPDTDGHGGGGLQPNMDKED